MKKHLKPQGQPRTTDDLIADNVPRPAQGPGEPSRTPTTAARDINMPTAARRAPHQTSKYQHLFFSTISGHGHGLDKSLKANEVVFSISYLKTYSTWKPLVPSTATPKVK